MMPVVPNGAPRFVEQTHGQGAGWLGPVYNPMRIDADASLPDYRVGDFSLHADLTPLRAGGRRSLVASIGQQVRQLEQHPDVHAMDSHYDRAFSLLASPEVTRAFDIAQAAHGRRVYRVAARHRGSGELVGHTVLVVESERPGWGWQFDTSVVRAHRGHRLGLLLKADMLRWLADAEPQLRIVDTWNAATPRPALARGNASRASWPVRPRPPSRPMPRTATRLIMNVRW